MTDEFKSFEQVAQDLKNEMDKVSGTIKKTEKTLQDLKLGLPFSIPLDDGSISWEKNGEKYRLCWANESGSKPLISSPFPIRMKCYHQLNRFIKEFAKYIRSLREDIEKNMGLTIEN